MKQIAKNIVTITSKFYFLFIFLLLCKIQLVAASIEIEFLSVDESREVLISQDAFVTEMSDFDKEARLNVDHKVSEDEYFSFVQNSPLAWSLDDQAHIEEVFNEIKPALETLLPSLDYSVQLIKTSGAEEGGAVAYTRSHAIIVTEDLLHNNEFKDSLVHEIFHVISRNNPALRKQLYSIFGFEYCGEIDHPDQLADRRMTNPDAPINDYCILLHINGEDVWTVPILYADAEKYDINAGKSFFDYLTFSFLVVDRSRSTEPTLPILQRDGSPLLFAVGEVENYFEQIGLNTQYIIHPEEIAADNFTLLVLGSENVQSPELLNQMRETMMNFKSGE